MTVTAISDTRWEEAQRYEHEYWSREMRDPVKLHRDIADGHHFTAGLLDIRPDAAWACRIVLDIAGGPFPLGYPLGVGLYRVLDPGTYPDVAGIERILQCAEDYHGSPSDEVWGYNVLQHVKDPAAVMRCAREHAEHTIRWFDVVDTPIYPVHPHSIRADWLREQLSIDGFRIVRDIDGSRLVEGHRQKWVALVAERGV